MSLDLKRVDNVMIGSASEEIHLWLAFYNEGVSEHLDHSYLELLSASETERHARFHFSADRRRYLVTRALVRTVLSRYAPVAPRDWTFTTNAYGRPEIANDEGRNLHLSFNVSHADGLIVLGVATHRELGVDVEHVRRREVSIGIADRFFSRSEVDDLLALSSDQQQYRFFEYWTFKESYIKARGRGLSLPLDRFAFSYPDDHSVHLSVEPELCDVPTRWLFWQFRPTRDHLVAVCAERGSEDVSSVLVRQMTPLSSEKTLAITFTRTSK